MFKPVLGDVGGIRDLTPSVATPKPPQLASVRIERKPPLRALSPISVEPLTTPKSARKRRAPGAAGLSIPEAVKAPGVVPAASPARDARSAAQKAESSSTEMSYSAHIKRKIERQWDMFPMPYVDSLQVVLAFRVDRNGRVTDVVVDRTSGRSEYDDMAKRAVVEANPFPPFPSSITTPHLDVNYTFIFRRH